MKLRYAHLNSIYLLLIILLLVKCSNNESLSNIILPKFLEEVVEVDSKYLITPDTSIIFSSNKTGYYNLFKYKNGKNESISTESRDIFSPVLIDNKIVGLTDSLGNEQYKFTDFKLNDLVGLKPIKSVVSSPNGKFVIIQFKSDQFLNILNVEKKQQKNLCRIQSRLHGIAFSNDERIVIICYDNKILLYNLFTNKNKILALNLPGEKRNPYLFKDTLFFINNSNHEYYQIYRLNIFNKDLIPELIYNSNHDLLMPKFDGVFLYFIEVQYNEYLLKRKKLNEKLTQTLNKKGVVYNYDFYKKDVLSLIYSDINTPRSLALFDINENSLINISGNSIKTGINSTFIPSTENHSSAYKLYPPGSFNIKGIILFFHPGLHSDFSPRWDTILMSLIKSGYILIAPNYPMSFGYGKRIYKSKYQEAVKDMIRWKNNILKKNSDFPLFFLSASSGNILMEDCLDIDNKQVQAAISIFGLYRKKMKSINNPFLFIVGKHDPTMDFYKRLEMLMNYQSINNAVKIKVYENEGHWFKRDVNIKSCLTSILEILK